MPKPEVEFRFWHVATIDSVRDCNRSEFGVAEPRAGRVIAKRKIPVLP